MDTAAKVGMLGSEGVDTDKEIVIDILDAGEEAFSHLARIATHDEYWQADNGLAPVCAIHLLAEIGGYRAQLAINAAILGHYKETGDWLMEDAPYVLAHMGTGAIPATTSLMRLADTGMYVRSAAAGALVVTAMRHPETKPGIVASIRDAAQGEADIAVRTVLVDSLLDLKDAVVTGFICSDFYDVPTLDGLYAGRISPSLTHKAVDPVGIFSRRNKYLDAEPDEPWPPLASVAPRPDKPGSIFASGKIGRNEPCPCASGKKYKKCCMPSV